MLYNYCQQLEKPGAEFRGFTTTMALKCRLETKDATRTQTANKRLSPYERFGQEITVIMSADQMKSS